MRRPNFFIVGAPRCGTTALWTYLKAHPEIFMSSQKELYYFDSDLHPEGWIQPSLEHYLLNFASKRRGPEHIGYRDFVDVPRQVKAYFATFGRTSVHAIIFDDLKRDPGSVYENALRFLGASVSFVPEFVVVSANANLRYSRLQKNVARPPGLLSGVTRVLMPERLRSRVRRTILRANLVTQPRAPMDPAFRRHLQKEFEPEIEQLSKLLDLDLTSWSVN